VELQRSKKEGKDKALMVREAIEVDSDELMEPKTPI
jgi:predicted DNA-binding protein